MLSHNETKQNELTAVATNASSGIVISFSSGFSGRDNVKGSGYLLPMPLGPVKKHARKLDMIAGC